MSKRFWLPTALWALAACGGSDPAPSAEAQQLGALPSAAPLPAAPLPAASLPAASLPAGPLPAAPQAQDPEAEPANPAWATFVDPENGLSTQDVRDADREIVHFDGQSQAMIWAASGDAVSGWVTEGNELRWDRGGTFRVRFGSEAGEQRAYFTEAGPGTICNLSITAPERLSISPTDQTPPHS
jgi:hypothetical protein